MSIQEFKCSVFSESEEIKSYIEELQRSAIILPACEALEGVNNLLKTNFEYLPSITLDVVSGENLSVIIRSDSSVPLPFFDSIAKGIESLVGLSYKARLFDSSSGGVSVWGDWGDVELDDKNILFAGEMQEDIEEMKELVEGFGKVHNSLKKNTDILVAGENADQALLTKAKSQGVHIIAESEFWDYISSQP